VPLVARLGARVVLEVPEALVDMLGALEGVQSFARYGAPSMCDYSCPLMSLPLAFGTTLSTIPNQVPYVRADGERVKAWGGRLGEKRSARVGLVWSGGSHSQQTDAWSSVDRRRNLPIQQLAVLRDAPVEFISLQKGQPAESELDSLLEQGWAGPPILKVAEHLQDFADTAALMTHLDLLISVDTSVAHLAGAMAKPVWILNRYDACWRWLEERTDSPWYPTAKLYRQSNAGDWDSLMRQVALDLKAFA
jgi:hypothetical protein